MQGRFLLTEFYSLYMFLEMFFSVIASMLIPFQYFTLLINIVPFLSFMVHHMYVLKNIVLFIFYCIFCRFKALYIVGFQTYILVYTIYNAFC